MKTSLFFITLFSFFTSCTAATTDVQWTPFDLTNLDPHEKVIASICNLAHAHFIDHKPNIAPKAANLIATWLMEQSSAFAVSAALEHSSTYKLNPSYCRLLESLLSPLTPTAASTDLCTCIHSYLNTTDDSKNLVAPELIKRLKIVDAESLHTCLNTLLRNRQTLGPLSPFESEAMLTLCTFNWQQAPYARHFRSPLVEATQSTPPACPTHNRALAAPTPPPTLYNEPVCCDPVHSMNWLSALLSPTHHDELLDAFTFVGQHNNLCCSSLDFTPIAGFHLQRLAPVEQ